MQKGAVDECAIEGGVIPRVAERNDEANPLSQSQITASSVAL